MFQAKAMLYLYVETSLHVGSGRGLGAVDLPIQRERVTGYPMVQASGLKGRLRAETDPDPQRNAYPPEPKLTSDEWLTIFGPETANAADYAGALAVGDARLLLFPVRSLAGVFAWTTSLDALARFAREAKIVGEDFSQWPELPAQPPGKNQCWVNSDKLLAGGQVVLEEFSFGPDSDPQKAALVKKIADWLVAHVLPKSDTHPEYAYWRTNLPAKLCLLPEDAFRDFALYATEVQTHVKIEPETKTVKSGALWTAESLPVDTVLYSLLMATPPRKPASTLANAKTLLDKVTGLDLRRMHLGGDETTGQGMVALRFGGVK